MNLFVALLFGLTILSALLMFALVSILITTHAVEEFKAKLGRKAVMLINTGDRWVWTVGKVENGLVKTKFGTFIKTPHSVLFDNLGIPFGIAKSESAYMINPDLALFGSKTAEEGEEKVGGEIAEAGGFEKAEKLKYKGFTINFDNVRKFFSALSPASVNAKIQYEVANALEKERNFLNFNNVLLIIMLLLGGAVAFAIVKGAISGGSVQHLVSGAVSAGKSIIANNASAHGAVQGLKNVTVITG